MITLEQARQRLHHATTELVPVRCPVSQALGCILSEFPTSKIDLPPFNKSERDGYAVRADETATLLKVIGTIKAGEATDYQLNAGQALNVMTGAALPPTAGYVVMKEDVGHPAPGHILIPNTRKKNYICPQGADIHHGDRLYDKGMRITPLIQANLIACGLDHVEVYPKPRISIAITGNELQDSGIPLAPAKIYNTNGPLLTSLLTDKGYFPLNVLQLEDNLATLSQTFSELIAQADITIITGGISVGDFDFTQQALLANEVEMIFHKIAIKPGKPMAVFKKGRHLILALPGNPVAVFLAFHLFVLPTLLRMQGLHSPLAITTATLPADFYGLPSPRDQFLPIVRDEKGAIQLLDYHGSAHLLALDTCNGFAIIPAGTTTLPAGVPVAVFQIHP